MYQAELTMKGRIEEEVDFGNMRILPGTNEYIECKFSDIEYHYKQVAKAFKYDEDKDKHECNIEHTNTYNKQ